MVNGRVSWGDWGIRRLISQSPNDLLLQYEFLPIQLVLGTFYPTLPLYKHQVHGRDPKTQKISETLGDYHETPTYC